MKRSYIKYMFFPLILLFFTGESAGARELTAMGHGYPDNSLPGVKLENPVTVDYLKKNLPKSGPRLFLTPEIERQLKAKLKSDLFIRNYYNCLEKSADSLLKTPLLIRELEGFRLLAVSRQMVERMGVLCMVYRMGKNAAILERINKEVLAVCRFEDWNPQHFLDVAEMSFAVALAVDWTGEWLPRETLSEAKKALIKKSLLPSYSEGGARMGWINGVNNWNAVCHGGLIPAAIVTFDTNPELAARTISRALEKLPGSLSGYAPDGVYPEGPTYWDYGTSYTVVAANSLETALGKDFGITQSPGFLKSPEFVLQATAPSGEVFNYADCGTLGRGNVAVLMSWFAARTGDELFLDRGFFEHPRDLGRMAGPGLVWLSRFEKKRSGTIESAWNGNGPNPVAVFRDKENDFYLAVKGGKANLSHGNMDAGTFVFELDGVRWVVDPGNQAYYPLNRIGFNLSGSCQECPRWTLLTKKNQGHSTLTINDERFNVNATAGIVTVKTGERPGATIDLTPLYSGNVDKAMRSFVKEHNRSFTMEDHIVINDRTREINWGIMTVARVRPVKNGAQLIQDGKVLQLEIIEPVGATVSLISLDPPPLEIDKRIENLKRIEIHVPAWTANNRIVNIKVRLHGN